MTRDDVIAMCSEHLFPRISLLQRATLMLAINSAPDEAFNAIGELWEKGLKDWEEKGPDGLRDFLIANGAPDELVKMVMSYADRPKQNDPNPV